MLKYIQLFLIGIFISSALILSLGIGVTFGGDSDNYLDLGNYIFPQLKYDNSLPYSEKPFTLHGPVYPIFVHLIVYFSRENAQFVLAFFQFFCLLFSSFFVYKICSHYFPKQLATVVSVLFVLLPFNFIYSTMLLSETFTTFLFSIWLYLLFLTLTQNKNTQFAGIKTGGLLFLASILTLTKFGFLPLLGFSSILLIRELAQSFKNKNLSLLGKKVIKVNRNLGIIFLIISSAVLYWWISFNHFYYNKHLLSVATGRHLFNATILRSGILPDSADASLINFLNASATHQLRIAQWGENTLNTPDDLSNDKLYLDLAISAIGAEPVKFIKSSLISPFLLPLVAPAYYDETINALSSCSSDCRSVFKYMCTSSLPLCSVKSSFVNYVSLNYKYYPWVSIGLLAFFLFGCFYALLKSNDKFLKYSVFIFFSLLYFQVTSETVDGRYLLTLYPIYVILVFCSYKLWKLKS